jgi:hypothetical protein
MIDGSPSSTSLTYVVIFQPHLRMVRIYRSLFVMQELARHTISFYFEAIYWQRSWCHKGFKCLAYRQLSANFMVVTMIWFTHTTFLWATCCLICFITIVKPLLTLILTTLHTVYLIWKKGSRRVLSMDRGCLLLHDTWSHLWYIHKSVSDIFRGLYTPILRFVFPIGLMRLNTVRYFCHFISEVRSLWHDLSIGTIIFYLEVWPTLWKL